MKKRIDTENEAGPARALGGFNRAAGLIRASADITRATDRLAKIARRQIPIAVPTLVSRTDQTGWERRDGSQRSPQENRPSARINALQFMRADAIHSINGFETKLKAIDAMRRVRENELVGRAIDRAGLASSRTSIPAASKLPRESSSRESRWPEDMTGDSRERFARIVERSSSGMDALARMRNSERRFGFGNDSIFAKTGLENGVARFEGSGRSWSDLAGRAKRMLEGFGGFSIGRDERSEGSIGKYVAASRVPRGSMLAPASFSRPELAEPMRGVYGQESRNAPGSITINSTPTVVINASAGSSDVEGQVIGALRAHREELFDQFKRESVRRERAEF
jgi:hypothetical protein